MFSGSVQSSEAVEDESVVTVWYDYCVYRCHQYSAGCLNEAGREAKGTLQGGDARLPFARPYGVNQIRNSQRPVLRHRN